MKTGSSIIHVEFHSGELKGTNDYFGSKSAIYSVYSPKQIGVGRDRLGRFTIDEKTPYTNKFVTIRKGVIKRLKGGRTAPVKVIRVNN